MDISNKWNRSALVDVYFADVNKGWIVGYSYNDRGLILKTIDGGLTWTRQASKSSAYINAVSFCSANTGIVVGYYGTILNSNDGGNTWISHQLVIQMI